MSTVTVPRDVTSEDVVEALRDGLDPRYEVRPAMKMPRSPLLGSPKPAEPELILVTSGFISQAQVRIIRQAGHTDLRVTPGGVLGDLLVNALGTARQVRQALLNAPTLQTSGPPR